MGTLFPSKYSDREEREWSAAFVLEYLGFKKSIRASILVAKAENTYQIAISYMSKTLNKTVTKTNNSPSL